MSAHSRLRSTSEMVIQYKEWRDDHESVRLQRRSRYTLGYSPSRSYWSKKRKFVPPPNQETTGRPKSFTRTAIRTRDGSSRAWCNSGVGYQEAMEGSHANHYTIRVLNHNMASQLYIVRFVVAFLLANLISSINSSYKSDGCSENDKSSRRILNLYLCSFGFISPLKYTLSPSDNAFPRH